MIPEWVTTLLKGMGVEGAIIWALLSGFIASVGANAAQWRHSNKVYGYRLAERDTLKDALNNAASVIKDVLEDAETRNEIGEELADLLTKQATALEVMRLALSHTDGNSKANHDHAMSESKTVVQAVTTMADAIRQLHNLLMENRVTWSEQMGSIRSQIQTAADAVKGQISVSEIAIRNELRQLIGQESTVVVRRRVLPTRPTKRPSS